MKTLHLLLWSVAFAAAMPARAQTPFSEVVVFGGSTVDTGNLHLASGGVVAAPPYFAGRASNGPLWVEVLADRLGLQAPAPGLTGGTNYAWAGAKTGDGLSPAGTSNVGTQVGFFLADHGPPHGGRADR